MDNEGGKIRGYSIIVIVAVLLFVLFFISFYVLRNVFISAPEPELIPAPIETTIQKVERMPDTTAIGECEYNTLMGTAKVSVGQNTRIPEEAKKKTKTISDKYDKQDERIRLGEYCIVGTDKVVTIKEGEDIGIISRRFLGPDMELYVEVYNDISASTPLEVGQKIKIPKLELRQK